MENNVDTVHFEDDEGMKLKYDENILEIFQWREEYQLSLIDFLSWPSSTTTPPRGPGAVPGLL